MTELGEALRSVAERQEEAVVSFLMELAAMESPSHRPETQEPVQEYLRAALEELDFQVERLPGEETGGVLRAHPEGFGPGDPFQLLLGHCDTVWDTGTLASMPLVREENRLRGPGVFDMKGGLTQMVFALRLLRELDLRPGVAPFILVNSDEEVGSPESKPLIEEMAKRAARALVPEPGMGPEGRVKTARKGWGKYDVTVRGKAAHAGLDPTGGVSAILEMAHLIENIHGMTDLERGLTLNVGVVSGGTRSNVIAAEARCQVDARVLTLKDGRILDGKLKTLAPTLPGAKLEIEGGLAVPPLERTPRNRKLWEAARAAALELGVELEEAVAGGGSDGNTTSQYTATLDGIGPVGDGAHAPHEFLLVDKLLERTAILARLLLLDP